MYIARLLLPKKRYGNDILQKCYRNKSIEMNHVRFSTPEAAMRWHGIPTEVYIAFLSREVRWKPSGLGR